MGVHPAIGFEKFPKQGSWLNYRVEVCFEYDPSKTMLGEIVREDVEEPFRTIIALDDGRFVEAVECQYSPIGPRTECHCFAECECKMRKVTK